MGQHYLRGSDAHFKSWSQIVSMKDDGVESLNRKEAPIVSSETVGELTSSLQIFANFGTTLAPNLDEFLERLQTAFESPPCLG